MVFQDLYEQLFSWNQQLVWKLLVDNQANFLVLLAYIQIYDLLLLYMVHSLYFKEMFLKVLES